MHIYSVSWRHDLEQPGVAFSRLGGHLNVNYCHIYDHSKQPGSLGHFSEPKWPNKGPTRTPSWSPDGPNHASRLQMFNEEPRCHEACTSKDPRWAELVSRIGWPMVAVLFFFRFHDAAFGEKKTFQ